MEKDPPTSHCPICQDATITSQTGYCGAHQRAFENVKHAYSAWEEGYGGISIPKFLNWMKTLRGTGEKVKEVADHLLENPSRWG